MSMMVPPLIGWFSLSLLLRLLLAVSTKIKMLQENTFLFSWHFFIILSNFNNILGHFNAWQLTLFGELNLLYIGLWERVFHVPGQIIIRVFLIQPLLGIPWSSRCSCAKFVNLLNSIKRSDDYQNISEMKNIDYLPLIPPKIQVRDRDLILALIHLYTVPLSLLFLRGRGRRGGGRPLPLAFLVSLLSFITLLVGNKLQHQKCISTNTAIICQNHLLLFPP